MKEMSYVSLINILLSSVEEKSSIDSDTRMASQEDIDRYFG